MEIQEEEEAWVEAQEYEVLEASRWRCLTDSEMEVRTHSEDRPWGGGIEKPEAH